MSFTKINHGFIVVKVAIIFLAYFKSYNHSFTTNIMVSATKPLLVFGYKGLTIVTMFFCSKTMVNFRKRCKIRNE